MPLVAARANAGAFGLGWSAGAGEEELGGMVLLKPTSIAYSGTSAAIGGNGSVTYSSCTSLSLNGVFSADYENYVLYVSQTDSSSGYNAYARLRASGSDTSTSTYKYQVASVVGTGISYGANTETAARVHETGSYPHGYVLNVFSPYASKITTFRTFSNVGHSSGPRIYELSAGETSTNSYDGITLLSLNSISATGRVSVYGLVGA